MSFVSKIARILWGITLIVLGATLVVSEGESALIVATILAIGLLIDGARGIIYYFTMARFMVKGWMVLVRGVIRVILGCALLCVFDSSSTMLFVLITLLAWFIYSGVQDILMGLERKGQGMRRWWFYVAGGVLAIIIAIYYLITKNPSEFMVYLFACYLIFKGYQSIRRTMHRKAPIPIED